MLLITSLFIPQISKAEIGSIKSIEGPDVLIKRSTDTLDGKVKTLIESLDTVETNNSTVNIDFKDDTKVVIKENSKLLIDDFVFNPSQSSGNKLGLKIGFGTVRYASGQIAHANPQSVDIQTPTATIAVRGTDFNMTVDEIGRSLIVLVPSCDATNCVTGKIDVITLSGKVTLDQPYTATYVSQSQQTPIQPVKITNITDKQINNLLIVAVPKAIRDALKKVDNDKKDNQETDFQIQTQQQINSNKTQQQQVEIQPVILFGRKSGNPIAYTNNDPNNVMEITFGPNGGNATINLQRDQKTTTARVGNSASNTITIKQSK